MSESELTFTLWRAGLIEDIIKKKIPYQVLEDETIIAEIEGETRILSLEMQQENYKKDLEKYYPKFRR